jgi:hypothetical protein
MKNNHQNTNPPINHSVEIANLYHQQVLGLINVALSHNKSSIEAAHRRAAELLRVKNAKEVQEFVTQHIVSHMNESLSYAVDAYRLGLEANMQLSKVFAMQIQDGLGLAQDTLQSHPLLVNPISNMALHIVKNSLDKSQSALNGASGAR